MNIPGYTTVKPLAYRGKKDCQPSDTISKIREYVAHSSSCQLVGRHFFVRDHILGVWPVGRPYCMFCGREART